MSSYYYSLNEILEATDAAAADDAVHALISVCDKPPPRTHFKEDGFVLKHINRVLDLDDDTAPHFMSQLLDSVPLYHINLELVLDEALSERHHNAVILDALTYAFRSKPLPNTMKGAGYEDTDMSGGLRHPMLGHMEKAEMCEIYIRFLSQLTRYREDYGFEKAILGKHLRPFLEEYDGFLCQGEGKIKAGNLLAFGFRYDHDPQRPLETYVESGQQKARRMAIRDPRELAWAWLECDGYQARRCREIDRVMNIKGLPRQPRWVRIDVFCFLEREAMKQVFAETLIQADPHLAILGGAPQIATALRANAAGQVDESIQLLLSQTLNADAPYAGGAGKFSESGLLRAQEAKRSKLL